MFDRIDSAIPLMLTASLINPDSIPFWYPKRCSLQTPCGTELSRRNRDFSNTVYLGDIGYFDLNGHFISIINIFDNLAATPGFRQFHYDTLAMTSQPHKNVIGNNASLKSLGIQTDRYAHFCI
jgi:hypothetical protein